MSVEVTMNGRLGNHLFQYAFARLVAERMDLQLTAVAPRQAGMGQDASLLGLAAHFPHAPSRIAGRVIDGPAVEVSGYEYGRRRRGASGDPFAELTAKPARYRLRDGFQRYEYFAEARERIRAWFTIVGVDAPEPQPADVLVNVRQGSDWGFHNRVLPLDYYDDALSSLGGLGQVFVCGTGIDDALRSRLAPYRPTYFDGTPIQHFVFMQRFARLVLSNSTFAWWAGFLSRASTLCTPKTPPQVADFDCSCGSVDLHMHGAPSYRPIEVTRMRLHKCLVPSTSALSAMGDVVDGLPRELVAWLKNQREPFTHVELLAHLTPADRLRHGEVLKALMKHRLLTYDPKNFVEGPIDASIVDPQIYLVPGYHDAVVG